MRVFVLGGTGFIGATVVRVLIQRGHSVIGLARSEVSAGKLRSAGAQSLTGDIAAPEQWIKQVPLVDAVIHAACDLATDMGAVDRRLLDELLPRLAARPNRTRFIYTGGCWLFGSTGQHIATEETPFAPLTAFAWMVPHARRVLSSSHIVGIVIHPAMVYTADGGVFSRFAGDARERAAIRVVESEDVRWPLVHRDDLAELYALALQSAPPGSSYIGVAIDGLEVGRIARSFAGRFGLLNQAPRIISADQIAGELGEWARGYACDQCLSGAKARAELGWQPTYLDPEGEIGALD
jgi:nucleoside-diphosphate-sugar epimerase